MPLTYLGQIHNVLQGILRYFQRVSRRALHVSLPGTTDNVGVGIMDPDPRGTCFRLIHTHPLPCNQAAKKRARKLYSTGTGPYFLWPAFTNAQKLSCHQRGICACAPRRASIASACVCEDVSRVGKRERVSGEVVVQEKVRI